MGILVPEEYEGLGLNNTQYARLSEVGTYHILANEVYFIDISIIINLTLVGGNKIKALFW